MRAEGESLVWELLARLILQMSSMLTVLCALHNELCWGGGRAAEQRLMVGSMERGTFR